MTRQLKLIFLYSSLLLFVMNRNLFAAIQAGDDSNSFLIPSGFVSIESRYCIFVEKSTQKLFLYKAEGNNISIVKEYNCSTGKNHGDKSKSGDHKTPEGVYFFSKVHSDDQLLSRYGVMAIVLDFPNLFDKREGKGGNGIWLHGIDRPLIAYDTKGCIALNNDDIVDVGKYITLFDTPIIIEEKFDRVSIQDQIKKREEVKGFISRWINSWKGKDFELYESFYSSTRFKPSQWSKALWRKNKRFFNKKYKFIDVDVRKLNIIQHDKYFTVSFIQDYESEKFQSKGFKKLFLQRNSENLKIIGERFVNIPTMDSSDEGESVSENREVCRFLNRWILSWEKEKIDSYMDCYSKSFFSQKMNRQQWKDHKQEINNSNKMIRVTVEKPEIIIDGNKAIISFIQKYVSDTYTDYGLKRLTLRKENQQWKIIKESWEAIQ